MRSPPWIKVAESYIGTKEVKGPKDNPLIIEMYKSVGLPQKHDEVAWCAAFMGHCLKKANQPYLKSLWALDYAKYGVGINAPIFGCIGVKKRNGGGHVGYVVGANSSTIFLLGANQADSVSIAGFPRSEFVAYRLPLGYVVPNDLPPLATNIAGAKLGVSQS